MKRCTKKIKCEKYRMAKIYKKNIFKTEEIKRNAQFYKIKVNIC